MAKDVRESIGKFAALTVGYMACRMVVSFLFPFSPGFSEVPPGEEWFLLPGLFLECASFAFTAFFVASRSRLPVAALAVRLDAVLYLVSVFLTQIETLFFRAAFPVITDRDIVLLFLAPIPSVAALAAGAARLYARGTGEAAAQAPDFRIRRNPLRWLAAAVVYVVCYLAFGMVAQLSPALQAEYAEFYALPASYLALMPLFQVGRGLLFAFCAAFLSLFFARRKDARTAASLAFSVWIAAALFTPTIIMNPTLRIVHGLEIVSSMVLYGILAVSILTRKVKDTAVVA